MTNFANRAQAEIVSMTATRVIFASSDLLPTEYPFEMAAWRTDLIPKDDETYKLFTVIGATGNANEYEISIQEGTATMESNKTYIASNVATAEWLNTRVKNDLSNLSTNLTADDITQIHRTLHIDVAEGRTGAQGRYRLFVYTTAASVPTIPLTGITYDGTTLASIPADVTATYHRHHHKGKMYTPHLLTMTPPLVRLGHGVHGTNRQDKVDKVSKGNLEQTQSGRVSSVSTDRIRRTHRRTVQYD